MLRVDRVDEVFDAAETLARAKGVRGDRLMIVSNGGGPSVMATDALVRGGGRLAELPDAVRASLSAVLPETWSNGNPIDLVGDAPGQRYADALRAIASADTADAILVIHAPTAIAARKRWNGCSSSRGCSRRTRWTPSSPPTTTASGR